MREHAHVLPGASEMIVTLIITNAALWLWLGGSIARGQRRRAKPVTPTASAMPIALLYPTLESATIEALRWKPEDDWAFERFANRPNRRSS